MFTDIKKGGVMAGYTKLFSEIVMSTVWREADHIRLVWITMLALRDHKHIVNASIPGLADAARVKLEQCEDAIKCLSSPDKYSRTQEEEGRRIIAVDGGWYIVNGEKYRKKMNLDERREYQKEKQREYRKKKTKEKQEDKSAFTDGLQVSTKVDNIYTVRDRDRVRVKEDLKTLVRKKPRTPTKQALSHKIIQTFASKYEAFVGAPLQINWGKFGKLAKGLGDSLGATGKPEDQILEHVDLIAERYFKSQDPKWWDFSTFVANFNKFQAIASGADNYSDLDRYRRVQI